MGKKILKAFGPAIKPDVTASRSVDSDTFQFKDNRPETLIQRQFASLVNGGGGGAGTGVPTSNGSHVLQTKAASPLPNRTGLPDQVKNGVEALSGYTLDDVKVHYNSTKPGQLQAHAYAQGTDIHIAPGQEKHLPHEAWHVVQQKQGRVSPTHQMKSGVRINDDLGLEEEADRMGEKALQRTAVKGSGASLQSGGEGFIGDFPIFPEAVQLKATVSVSKLSGGIQEVNGDPSGNVLQRFQAQIVAKEDEDGNGVIADIKLTGRTPSPHSGTMGAHSTAWVVHTDGLRRQLQGLTLDAAIVKVGGMLNEAISSPQMDLAPVDTNPFSEYGKLKPAMDRAQAMQKGGYKGKDESGKTVWLEDFIYAYLDLVNHLPLATVLGAKTTGDTEGDARTNLIRVEGGGVEKAEVIRKDLAALFATDTPGGYVKSQSDFLGKPAGSQVWDIALHGFLHGIRKAYPIAYVAAELDDDRVLGDFLRGLHPDVPDNILDLLAKLGDKGGLPDQPELQLLEGGAGTAVGGDLAVQVRFSAEGTVEDVRMEGRTPSPFVGSMGAHSTAWVAHLDALRAALGGRDLIGAVHTVLLLSVQAQTSPLLSLVPFILPDQARLLASSQVELQYFQRIIQQKGASELILKTRLQQLISAYLQFTNALPLHTAEAASTVGNSEGTWRARLLAHEAGKLTDFTKKDKKGKVIRHKTILKEDRLETAFWSLYDANSAASFSDNLFPEPPASTKIQKRNDGRESRKGATYRRHPDMVEFENKEKRDSRARAFVEKPLEEGELKLLQELEGNAGKVETKNASLLLPHAMALNSFLHSMEVSYPRSYSDSWGDLDNSEKIRLITRKLNVDGTEVLGLMAGLPVQEQVKGTIPITKLAGKLPADSSGFRALRDTSALDEHPLRRYEQDSARRDGISASYQIGHASGTWNACLIFSLLRHALGRDATVKEVDQIRSMLAKDHEDIREGRQITIYSPTGHAVIDAIERVHGVSLNVSVVTTRDAPIVPVTIGQIQALLYLMPGHFVPCWRRR
ncbi:DUF4157 domain-containing protein [Algoriphagus sp. NG3]|uniref:eCIS core domain-containing protein n=1 Tax=Algoriphagus sp. NG3 TaxID=3097546 RepID=UPI002A836BC3|nr:DUF4157 domain-containing protein [Algoriphagus sp. NG3]WPR77389.1 DUF4157 domain-containing protein [Algoriphagus sp. NG3]